jgi:hypothetical protein
MNVGQGFCQTCGKLKNLVEDCLWCVPSPSPIFDQGFGAYVSGVVYQPRQPRTPTKFIIKYGRDNKTAPCAGVKLEDGKWVREFKDLDDLLHFTTHQGEGYLDISFHPGQALPEIDLDPHEGCGEY